MTRSSRAPLSAVEKVLMFGAPALLLVLVGGALWQSKMNAVPAVAFPTPIPLPKPNGYDFYVAAANSIKSAQPPVDANYDTKNTLQNDPQRAAQNFSLARKQAWLRANTAGFELFRQGVATPTVHPSERGLFLSNLGQHSTLRLLMRKKEIEAHTFALQKRWNDAVQSSLDNVQMGSDMARGGNLIAKLVGTSIVAVGRSPLTTDEDLPEHLDAPQARAAAKRLEAMLARRWSYQDALKEERWNTLSQFLAFTQTPKWRSQAAGRNATWRDRIAAQTQSKTTVVAQINRSFDVRIADLGKPYSARASVPPPLDAIAAMFSFSTPLKPNEGREIVPLDILRLRFALRAYRLENGAYPASLTQLAPKYLAKIPTDYYADNAPFYYVLKGADYRLWSIGPDGKNDGGKPIPWRYDGTTGAKNGFFPPITTDDKGDYVARENN